MKILTIILVVYFAIAAYPDFRETVIQTVQYIKG